MDFSNRQGIRQIEVITQYRTADGRGWDTPEAAVHHSDRLGRVEEANQLFKSGSSLADALRHAGWSVEDGSVLERVTAETDLIVRYYHGTETPAYRVRGIEWDMALFISGSAPQSQFCGYCEPVSNVAQYAEATFRYLERHPPGSSAIS